MPLCSPHCKQFANADVHPRQHPHYRCARSPLRSEREEASLLAWLVSTASGGGGSARVCVSSPQNIQLRVGLAGWLAVPGALREPTPRLRDCAARMCGGPCARGVGQRGGVCRLLRRLCWMARSPLHALRTPGPPRAPAAHGSEARQTRILRTRTCTCSRCEACAASPRGGGFALRQATGRGESVHPHASPLSADKPGTGRM